MKKLTLSINWPLTLFTTLLLPVLISLGFWQLSRMHEKQLLISKKQKLHALPALTVLSLDDVEQLVIGRRLKLTVAIDEEKYWLFDGKVNRGLQGYWLIVCANMGQKNFLVNLGWIKKTTIINSDFFNGLTKDHTVNISGSFMSPKNVRFIAPHSPMTIGDIEHISWPKVIAQWDIAAMSKQIKKPLFDQVLQIDADSALAQEVNWHDVVMSPERHRAYAVQWFAMAVVLSVMWIFANSNVYERLRLRCVANNHQPDERNN